MSAVVLQEQANLIRTTIREVLDDLAQPDVQLEASAEIDGLTDPEAGGGDGAKGAAPTTGTDDRRLGGSEPTAEL
ncbi:hypothetical protein [Sedimentimonas flavescens]|uniref:hypothetical protein n=1 Tax=Sedimentimonas flavescens TaxID=2851012 RepID=UPI0021A84567|nr:hypothetical protein [Sedimentimonas flavescens]MCT2538752.1 hypothetical protein [Sedimentimonas flavescens]